MIQLPWCASCGSHFRPTDQENYTCKICTVEINKPVAPGHRPTRFVDDVSPEWQNRWDQYWQQQREAAA